MTFCKIIDIYLSERLKGNITSEWAFFLKCS